MAAEAITDLVADAAPILTDLFESVKDPAGTPLSRKVTHGDAIARAFQVASGVPATNTDVSVFTGAAPLSGEFLDEADNFYYKWNGAKWQRWGTNDF